jgi:hypothetical protein
VVLLRGVLGGWRRGGNAVDILLMGWMGCDEYLVLVIKRYPQNCRSRDD